LTLINSIGIFNLDIKDLNIAVKSFGSIKKAYFTDWDLAFVEPSGSTAVKLEAFESYIEKKYGSYEEEYHRVNFYITRLPNYGKFFEYLKNEKLLNNEDEFKKKIMEKLFAFLFFKKYGYVSYHLNANKLDLSEIKNEQKLNIYRACFKRIDAFCLMIIFHDKYTLIKQIFDQLDSIQ